MKKPIFYLIFLFIAIPCLAQAQEASLNPAQGVPASNAREDDCFPQDHRDYQEWVLVGKPACWCYLRQCRGDVDGVKTGPFWVAIPDLNALKAAFNKTDLVLAGIPNGICSDFDHTKTGPFRVGIPDLNIFRTYFNKVESYVPDCFWDHPWP